MTHISQIFTTCGLLNSVQTINGISRRDDFPFKPMPRSLRFSAQKPKPIQAYVFENYYFFLFSHILLISVYRILQALSYGTSYIDAFYFS